MSITTDEQLTNRRRVLMVLPKCGLSKKQLRRVAKLIGKAPPAEPQKIHAPLRYGDGMISPTLTPWTGRLGEPPDEIR